MKNFFAEYGYTPDKEAMGRALDLIAANLENMVTRPVLLSCFSMMDVTSLKTDDTRTSMRRLVEKVNNLQKEYPDYPMPASICVYPDFVETVKASKRCDDVHITAVAGCFPSSQSFLEVKLLECGMAVEKGADEIDIVLALNDFLDEDYSAASEEIRQIRSCIDEKAAEQGRKVCLKVILETGLLMSPDLIAKASFLAMEAGADFIKTSTGKVSVNATPAAAYTMCECIAAYYRKTGRKVGFKPAGGISSVLDAVSYYTIVSTVLGEEWLDKSLFRFGVSRMANNIISELEQKTVSYL